MGLDDLIRPDGGVPDCQTANHDENFEGQDRGFASDMMKQGMKMMQGGNGGGAGGFDPVQGHPGFNGGYHNGTNGNGKMNDPNGNNYADLMGAVANAASGYASKQNQPSHGGQDHNGGGQGDLIKMAMGMLNSGGGGGGHNQQHGGNQSAAKQAMNLAQEFLNKKH
eukprot:GHVH01010681.1.p1 GENE.GHVH01010681.1~~GHVH01010681.1.p1  ORF type:complete len:166 (-),score=28.46 GHVH01010681.1:61-558(-)